MDDIKQYLLTVIISAAICAVVTNISCESGTHKTMIRVVAGTFVTVITLSPLIGLRLPEIKDYFDIYSDEVSTAVESGRMIALEERNQIIAERVCAYILDKASVLGADIEVQVHISRSDPGIPESVVITGDVSPYTKSVIQNMISEDLGIPEGAQLWR